MIGSSLRPYTSKDVARAISKINPPKTPKTSKMNPPKSAPPSTTERPTGFANPILGIRTMQINESLPGMTSFSRGVCQLVVEGIEVEEICERSGEEPEEIERHIDAYLSDYMDALDERGIE